MRYQYQAKFEPIVVPSAPETILLDKWLSPDARPLIDKRKYYVSILNNISFYDIASITPAPTGIMRFNLTPRIYRMLYYNQWS